MPGKRGTMKERLMRRVVENEDGCWIWTGAQTGHKDPRQRYGLISTVKGKAPMGVHRASYIVHKGKIGVDENGKTLVVDHLCYDKDGYSNKLCINPDHLQLLTDTENKKEGYHAKRRAGNWKHYTQREVK